MGCVQLMTSLPQFNWQTRAEGTSWLYLSCSEFRLMLFLPAVYEFACWRCIMLAARTAQVCHTSGCWTVQLLSQQLLDCDTMKCSNSLIKLHVYTA